MKMGEQLNSLKLFNRNFDKQTCFNRIFGMETFKWTFSEV